MDIFSEITEPNLAGKVSEWSPFKIKSPPPFQVAIITKNRNFFTCLLLLYQSRECPLLRLPILFLSDNKHGCHKQFLFLVGRFLKIFSENASMACAL